MPGGARNKTFAWIDWLKAFAALAVVVIHVTAQFYRMYDSVSPCEWWIANALNSLSRFGVPVFVMISGAMLLGREQGVLEFYRKRALRVLPPFFFWTVVYASYLAWSEPSFLFGLANALKFGLIAKGGVYYHLWYLTMYMELVLFLPFLNMFLLGQKPTFRDLSVLLGVVALVLLLDQVSYLTEARFGVAFGWHTSFVCFLGYAIFGYYLNAYQPSGPVRPGFWALIAAVAAMTGMAMNYWFGAKLGHKGDLFFLRSEGVLVFIMAGAVFLLFRLNDRALKETRLLKSISHASFGIYLLHPLIISLIQRHTPGYFQNGALFIPLGIVFVFLLSYACISILRRIAWFRAVC